MRLIPNLLPAVSFFIPLVTCGQFTQISSLPKWTLIYGTAMVFLWSARAPFNLRRFWPLWTYLSVTLIARWLQPKRLP